MHDLQNYSHLDDDFLDKVKTTIDEKVKSSMTGTLRGMLRTATTGFGKGVIAVAAATLVVTLAATLGAPALGATTGEMIASAAVNAVSFLLSPVGIMGMMGGGTLGAVATAHSENKRLNHEQAELMAQHMEKLREGGIVKEKTIEPKLEATLEEPCKGGHCAALLKAREQQQGQVAR